MLRMLILAAAVSVIFAATGAAQQLTLSHTSASEGVGNVQLAVTRSVSTNERLSFTIRTSGGTATGGSSVPTGTVDYREIDDSGDFFPGSSSSNKVWNFLINDDTFDEDDEYLMVELTPQGGTTTTYRFTILDNDPAPTVELGTGGIGVSEGGQATLTATLSAASGKEVTVGYRTNDGTGANAAVAGEDYQAASGTLTFAAGETTKTITVNIGDDSLNELSETFTVELSGPNNAELGTTVAQTVTIAADTADPQPSVAFVTDTVSVREGTTLRVVARLSEASGREVAVDYETSGGSATVGQDYVSSFGTLTFAKGQIERSITVAILSDDEMDENETFYIEVYSPEGATLGLPSEMLVTILEGDDPILEPISDYLTARAETLLELQPVLTRFLNGSDADAARGVSLRAGSGGVSAEGGFARGGVWIDASGAWSEVGGADSRHVVGTLGAHREVSDGLLLGGMLQYDAIDAELTDGAGSIEGKGWMAGPYFAANGASGQLRFEGRLLYGRSSNDIDFTGSGAGARAGSFEGERWLALARVEGERPLGNGATMIPSASFGHARETAKGFRDSLGGDVKGQSVAVTRLHIGTGFEIPVEAARGDLTLRPDMAFVLTDASGLYKEAGSEFGGRIGFGVDYRLEDSVSLGFEGFYSEIGRTGSEIYGAGLNLRMRF